MVKHQPHFFYVTRRGSQGNAPPLPPPLATPSAQPRRKTRCLRSLRRKTAALTNTLLFLNAPSELGGGGGGTRPNKKRHLLRPSSLPPCPAAVPGFSDVIQGQAMLHGIKVFNKPTAEPRWMMVFVCSWANQH